MSRIDDDPARGPLEGLALLREIHEIPIDNLDARLVGVMSVLYPRELKEVLARVIEQQEQKENGS